MGSTRTHTIKETGFVVLMSVIIISIVLTISIGIMGLTLRELILVNIEKESLRAFYAADAGIDCLFHNDVRSTGTKFPGPITASLPMGGPSLATIKCNGPDVELIAAGPIISGSEVEFSYTLDPSTPLTFANGTCVLLKVQKFIDTTTDKVRAEITARGFNTCNLSTPRRVERALVLKWESF